MGIGASSKKFNDRNIVYVLRGAGLMGYDFHVQTKYCLDFVKKHSAQMYLGISLI